MSKRELTLHIGTGKAGSTSIQKFLISLDHSAQSTRPLEAFGLPNAKFLTMSLRSAEARSYFVSRVKTITEQDFERNAESIWQKALEEIEASGKNRFVSSSEFICNMVRGADIESLKRNLDELFDRVLIVVYLRDQTSFLRSVWSQSIKGPSKATHTFHEFLRKIDEHRYLWDYSIFLKDWLRTFGFENLKVSIFDERALAGNDVVKDFCRKAGIIQETANPPKRFNVSPKWNELETMRLNNLTLKQGSNSDFGLSHQKEFKQSDYEDQILTKVSEGNQWVNQTFFRGHRFCLPVK